MTGKRALATLAVIVLATAVVPPAGAWAENRRRINRAMADEAAIAEPLTHAMMQLRKAADDVDVLCGPGRVPLAETPATRRWAAAHRGTLGAEIGESAPVPVDPWGNCYVVNVGALRATEPATLWVLSAGPNGIIETPFIATSSQMPMGPMGDDVGRQIAVNTTQR